jgi:hypothetical protein
MGGSSAFRRLGATGLAEGGGDKDAGGRRVHDVVDLEQRREFDRLLGTLALNPADDVAILMARTHLGDGSPFRDVTTP